MSRAGAWNKFSRRIPRNVDPGRGQRWVTVKNMSGETIPAYAAMEPYGVDRDGNILVRKPTQDDSNKCILNGGSVIGVGDYGTGTNHMATWAYYEVSDGDPAVGEMLGTRSGYWKLHRGYEGFLAWGGASEMGIGIVKVQRDLTCRVAGGYYPGYYPRLGRGYCCGCARFDCAKAGNQAFPNGLDFTLTVGSMGTLTTTLALLNPNFPLCADMVNDGVPVIPTYYDLGQVDFLFGTSVDHNLCDASSFNDPSQLEEEAWEISLTCQNYRPDLDGVGSIASCDGRGRWYIVGYWNKVIGSSPGIQHIINFCGPVSLNSCSPLHFYGAQTASCNLTSPVTCNYTTFQTFSDYADEDGTSVEAEAIE